jgi:hypothetical protein
MVSVVGADTTLTPSFAREEVIGITLSPSMSADLSRREGARSSPSLPFYKVPAMRGYVA